LGEGISITFAHDATEIRIRGRREIVQLKCRS
jgi:hypothetical protein